MDIIFLWDEDLNKEKHIGIMLSGKYLIDFNIETKEMNIRDNEAYVRGFWGKNIQDCYAIVGVNGAGKTRLSYYIREDVKQIQDGTKPRRNFILLVDKEKHNQKSDLCVYCTNHFSDLKVTYHDQNCPVYNEGLWEQNDLKNFQIAYFHNDLGRHDYEINDLEFRYDFSNGGMMQKFRRTTFEMHYNTTLKDVIKNYFDNQDFKIIDFLLHIDPEKKAKIDFPMPKFIKISLADDQYIEKYLMEEAEKLGATKEEIDQFVRCLNRLANTDATLFGRAWIPKTLKSLLLNCFKLICIPSTVPNNMDWQCKSFMEACMVLTDDDAAVQSKRLYDGVDKVIENLKKRFHQGGDIDYLHTIEAYINWIKSNEANIKKYELRVGNCLQIPINHRTNSFITELIDHYQKVNFEFPFYDFSFGVSTGEYHFLSVFENLYSITKKAEFINPYETTFDESVDSLLLIFDEADLSLHPKWQRMYMKWMTDFCKKVFENLSIKIIITTHSPILLSDFPGNSILYIEKDEQGEVSYHQRKKNTFGCNIHSLFLDSFFLEETGTMGALAEEKINEIAQILLQPNGFNQYKSEELVKIIHYIGEGIVREKLEKALEHHENRPMPKINETEKTVVGDMLVKLKRQRNQLNQLIAELEVGLNDKN